MQNTNSISKQFFAVIGATILSVIGPQLIEPDKWKWVWWVWFIIAVIILLYSFHFIDSVLLKIKIYFRDSSFFSTKVGIIFSASGFDDNSIPSAWTNISPNYWKALLDSAAKKMNKRLTIHMIDVKSSFDSYNVIINPYGGNLPELNFSEFPVYNKLLNYIKNGGFFVNVADIPTYWSFNPLINSSVNRTPAVYDISGAVTRPFQRTPLLEELALCAYAFSTQPINTYSLERKYDLNNKRSISLRLSRAVKVEKHIKSVIKPIKIQPHTEVTPLFFCNYGEGLCLISMSWLDIEQSNKRSSISVNYGIDNKDLKETIPSLIIHGLFNKKQI